MKKNYFVSMIFLVVLFVMMPLNVNAAAEFNTYEITMEEPVTGGNLIKEAVVTFSNEELSKEYEVELKWVCDGTDLVDADTFQKDMLCMFDFTEDDYTYMDADFDLNEYTMADSYDFVINDYLFMEDYSGSPTELHLFYIGGISELQIDTTGVEVGNTPLDTKVAYTIVSEDEEQKIVFSPVSWCEVDGEECTTLADEDKFEAGKVYRFEGFNEDDVIEGDAALLDEIFNKIDIRTKFIFNGEEVGINFDVEDIGPLVLNIIVFERFDNVINTATETKVPAERDYETTLVANDGYKLPEKIKVLVGSTELNEEQYNYDYTTGKLIVFGSNITDNITLEVSGEKIIVENPDTNDAVIIAIFLTIISFITIVVLKIHFKKLV